MSEPNTFKDVVETLYYISGITVAAGVVFAIRQYYSFKKDIKTKYDREINTATSDQLRAYYLNVLPKYEEIKKTLKGEPFTLGEKQRKIIQDNVEQQNSAASYISTLDKSLIDSMTALTAELQVFAVNFAYGNADTELANKSILDSFLKITESIVPIYFLAENMNVYKESIDLFNQWKIKKRKMDNSREAADIKTDEDGVKPYFPRK